MRLTRRKFLKSFPAAVVGAGSLVTAFGQGKRPIIMTVNGQIFASETGITLPHEHILVDFIGAKHITPDRWSRDAVIDVALPFLDEAKRLGCRTFIDCTPNYLGRDVQLLKNLSELSGLNIITNTGFYGGSDEKFLPEIVFSETPKTIASYWINEWKRGIESTGVKPGLIKISVNEGPLTEVSQKLIQAAAIAHNQTGLTIVSHTGRASAAFEQLDILKKSGVSPTAFVWAHAQNEKDLALHVKAANEGAWISLDGLNDDNVDDYNTMILNLQKENYLHRALVSHDAGWYDPSKPGGGAFRGYTTLFKKLIPLLRASGLTDSETARVIKFNPADAFTLGIKRFKK